MTMPYFRTVELTVPEDAASAVFTVGFPPQGKLVFYSCRQIDEGTPVAAEVRLFRHAPAAGDVTERFEIAPHGALAITAGDTTVQRWTAGYDYQNIETGSWTNRNRQIYVQITPTGAAAPTTWEVQLGVIPGVVA